MFRHDNESIDEHNRGQWKDIFFSYSQSMFFWVTFCVHEKTHLKICRSQEIIVLFGAS